MGETMEAESELLTTGAAADALGTSTSYLLQLVAQGKLRVLRAEGANGPGPRLFARQDIQRLVLARVATALERDRIATLPRRGGRRSRA